MKLKKLIITILLLLSLTAYKSIEEPEYIDIQELRKLYSSGDASKWPAAALHESIDTSKFQDIGVLPAVPYPDYNPYSKEKESLGKILFLIPDYLLADKLPVLPVIILNWAGRII